MIQGDLLNPKRSESLATGQTVNLGIAANMGKDRPVNRTADALTFSGALLKFLQIQGAQIPVPVDKLMGAVIGDQIPSGLQSLTDANFQTRFPAVWFEFQGNLGSKMEFTRLVLNDRTALLKQLDDAGKYAPGGNRFFGLKINMRPDIAEKLAEINPQTFENHQETLKLIAADLARYGVLPPQDIQQLLSGVTFQL